MDIREVKAKMHDTVFYELDGKIAECKLAVEKTKQKIKGFFIETREASSFVALSKIFKILIQKFMQLRLNGQIGLYAIILISLHEKLIVFLKV